MAARARVRCEQYLGRSAVQRWLPWRSGGNVAFYLEQAMNSPDSQWSRWVATILRCREEEVEGPAVNFGRRLAPGLVVELQGVDQHNKQIKVLFEGKGEGPPSAVVHWPDKEQPFLAWAAEALGWPPADVAENRFRVRAIPNLPSGAFGGPVPHTMLDGTMTAEQVEWQRTECAQSYGFLREGILGGDAYPLACFAWVIAMLKDETLRQQAERWVRQEIDFVRAFINTLAERGVLSQKLREGLEARWSPAVHHCPLVCLPFLVGSMALVQRLLAMAMIPPELVRGEEGHWRALGRGAARYAYELYVQDLCLMELALYWHHPPRRPQHRGML